MHFKIDENLPVEAADLLRDAGHTAATIHKQSMVGRPDPDVARICQQERRALVTLDLDFSDIRVYPPDQYHGIIVLRPRVHAKPSALALVQTILSLFGQEPLDGRLWIVDPTRVRIRDGGSTGDESG